jgi:hypothetical protein
MSCFICHEQRYRAPNDVSRLVISLAERGDDLFGDNGGVGPGGRDGVDADGEVGVELRSKGAEKAEDGVFGSCCVAGIRRNVELCGDGAKIL